MGRVNELIRRCKYLLHDHSTTNLYNINKLVYTVSLCITRIMYVWVKGHSYVSHGDTYYAHSTHSKSSSKSIDMVCVIMTTVMHYAKVELFSFLHDQYCGCQNSRCKVYTLKYEHLEMIKGTLDSPLTFHP